MKSTSGSARILAAMAVFGLFLASPSFAASKLAKACGADLKRFSCKKAKSDHDAHECIENNEKEGEPNEGLSEDCFKAHQAYEQSLHENDAAPPASH